MTSRIVEDAAHGSNTSRLLARGTQKQSSRLDRKQPVEERVVASGPTHYDHSGVCLRGVIATARKATPVSQAPRSISSRRVDGRTSRTSHPAQGPSDTKLESTFAGVLERFLSISPPDFSLSSVSFSSCLGYVYDVITRGSLGGHLKCDNQSINQIDEIKRRQLMARLTCRPDLCSSPADKCRGPFRRCGTHCRQARGVQTEQRCAWNAG